MSMFTRTCCVRQPIYKVTGVLPESDQLIMQILSNIIIFMNILSMCSYQHMHALNTHTSTLLMY